MSAESRTENIPVRLEDGSTVLFEASVDGEEDVALAGFDLTRLTGQITSVARAVVSSLEQAAPTKATVEFGVEVATGAGGVTAVFVKGTAKANLKVTLEWSSDRAA
ncbi:CU044_2847 family protein [Phytohabitans flavus]|uniref:CU044_2847 family protein n=1 Tax=Phytohabitans flavus TaxID=1076124 RepID=UPI00156606A0|nr:CU044_2847 family protein [Phytohabitans flavus]